MNDFLKALIEEEKLLKKLKQLKKKSNNSSFINIPYFKDSKTLDSDFKINFNDNYYTKKKIKATRFWFYKPIRFSIIVVFLVHKRQFF